MTSISILGRSLVPPENKSYFLLGPRGTGKSTWVRRSYPEAIYVDLLDSAVYNDLLARPERLELLVPKRHRDWVIVDEVQKVPALLDEVHASSKGVGFGSC